MSASTLDTVLTTYLSLHAVLALLIDAQSVLPDLAPSVLAAYQRAGLTQPVARWVADEGDFLVGSNPLWFRWIVGGEVLFQLPVCIALAFGFAKRRQWVRLPSLLYGTHVLTTMVPIMGVLCSDPRPSLTCKLVYAIWVLLPTLLMARCVRPLVFAAPRRTLWKIALPADVEAWEASGELSGSSLDLKDGFLHTSDAQMVKKVASHFFKGQRAQLLKIEPGGTHNPMMAAAVWVRGEDASDAVLAARKGEAGGADAVRVLTDGCAHLHLRRPLPMRGVRILPLELSTWSGEHVWPDELR